MVASSTQRPAEPLPSAGRPGSAAGGRYPAGPLIAGARPIVPRQRQHTPIGRVEIVGHVIDLLSEGGSVLVRGPAGIGKSTLLDAIAHDRRDALVLRVAAAEVESGLPYLTLVDLFGKVLADHGVVLRGHLRAALDAALLRTAAPATAQDELAVRLAVLELLRALCARRPVLLVIDDLPWVDEPSAGVLRFVARRLDGLPVQVIASARVAGGEMVDRIDLCPPPCHELTLPSLGADDVADLLRARFGDQLNRSAILRVHAASGGNPLYALELGRAVAERGEPITVDEPLPVPDRLRGLLTARIAALPETTREALVIAAAAARPSRELLARAGADADGDLRAAIEGGVVAALAADGAMRFTHPLLREMVYADAVAHDRARAHAKLAAAVEDPVERARHLALARTEPDERLAATLAEAAAVARKRGAPAIATELAQLAAERTADPALAAVRRLDAARFADAAGMLGEAMRNISDGLADATDPKVRVALRLLQINCSGQDQSRVGPTLDAAAIDAGDDPELSAQVHLYRGQKFWYDGSAEAAVSEWRESLRLAELADHQETVVAALSALGSHAFAVEAYDGEAMLERAAALARKLPLSSETIGARQARAMALLRRGEVDNAIRDLEALRGEVEQSGAVAEVAAVLISVTSAYLRGGRYADALSAGRTCMRVISDLEVTPGPGFVVGAQAELFGGDPETAMENATAAVHASQKAGDMPWMRHAYMILGQVRLLVGDPSEAAAAFRAAYDIEVARSMVDPNTNTWYADYIEALAFAGARPDAIRLLTELSARIDEGRRGPGLLSLARAAAVVTAVEGDPRAAAQELAESIDRWADHPFPFEVARAWHALGVIERRAHRRGAARDAFAEAARRYGMFGAVPWRGAVEAELARLNGPRGLGLSDTEQRIVDLVRRGATNREIARATFLSVKAIEANLTRLYRRFGVRNRDQLSRAIAEMAAAD